MPDIYEDRHRVWDAAREIGSPSYLLRRRAVLSGVPQHGEGLRALDAGCGPGDLTAELLRRGFRVRAFDLSPYAVERARRAAPPETEGRLDLSVGNIYELAPEPVCDLVLMVEVLEHVPDDRSALARAAACLKPGGTLVFTVPAHPSLWTEADVFSLHYRRYRREEAFELAASAGLEVRRLACFGFPLLRTYYLFKNRLAPPEAFSQNTPSSPGPRKPLSATLYRLFLETALTLDKRLDFTDLGVGYVAFCGKGLHAE